MARWIRSVETGNPYDIEHRIRGGDGIYRWFVVRGLPARHAEGHVVRWYILITDIDESKKTMRSWNAAKHSWLRARE